ncbi:MAG TPA: DJ-1/PfpI family protein, partial [Cellvibrionaceae bacterium]|nr:DJ-1/PfpI family protein [Cellvibrionaceae bacterium]
GKCTVTLASCAPELLIKASRGVLIQADGFIGDCLAEPFELIALPGGMPGASNLANCQPLINLLERQRQNGRALAAICAAPAVILGRLGWLKGKKATGFPAFKQELIDQGAQFIDQAVVQDGLLFTSQGPATAMALAVALVRHLQGDAVADEVANGLLLKKMT